MNAGLGLVLAAVLLLLNAFFVAAEFALVAARRSAIEPLAEAGSRRAAGTLRAMEHVSVMMAGAQLGITVCSLGLGAVSEPALAHLIEPVLDALAIPGAALHPISFALALVVITGLHVVIGEMVPKNLTLAGPDRAALWLGPPLAALVHSGRPLIRALNHTANLIVRGFGVQPRDDVASTANRDELADLIEQAHGEGLLDPAAHDLLTGAIGLDRATAADLALPLDHVHTLGPAATVADVEDLAAATGVTRFPVRRGAELVGYIHLKDTLGIPAELRDRPVAPTMIRSLPTVPAASPLSEAIEIMRNRRAQMARVSTAEATVGAITLDDVFSRLVPA